jgi:hypothetical protein
MNPRFKKILLLLLAAVLLVGVSRVQRVLNVDRERLGLTRIDPLDNAPPVLAFTTVALGGFRGLIANALWIRANDLQDADKFFEMAQLADWITKLEPHFVMVWVNQAWNMAYNISVKFKDFDDRWRWVQRGIALLRDDGLRFNPNETLIYRELAWFFQHKMGANLDDANMRYKQEWLKEMSEVFAKKVPDLDELINPQTDDARRRSQLLTGKYKMDPKFMQQVDERYGPLEWRLPESHAIYWAALGLEKARENPTKIKPDDLIQLRRAIYQSMQLSFQRGRLAANPFAKSFDFGPNLDIIPNVSAAYEQAMQEDAPNRDHIEKAHRNFLRDAVYFLYENNRLADSAKWYRYLSEKYPDKFLLDGNTNSFPRNLTLNEYAVERVKEVVGETSRDGVKAAIEGMLVRGYIDLVVGQPDRSAGYRLKARLLRDSFMSNIEGNEKRIGLPPVEDIENEVRERLLDPTAAMMPFEMRAILRTELRMPPEIAVPAAGTNAPAGATNAPVVPPDK